MLPMVEFSMDERTWTLITNTLILAGATCAISVPLGTVLGWVLVRTDLPCRRLAAMLVGLMLFIPLYLQVAAWQAGFGLQGWATQLLGMPPWLQGWTGAVWVHAMAAVPWVVLIVGLGLRLIEPELEQQALLDGSSVQVFFRVTLRGAVAAAGVAVLWVAVATSVEMTVTDLFVIRTFAEEIYTQFAMGPTLDEAPLGLAPGILLVFLLILTAAWLCTKLAPRDRPLSLQPRWTFQLGAARIPVAVMTVVLLTLLIGVPLLNLCYKAGVTVRLTDAEPLRSWSVWKCLKIVLVSPWDYRREFGWSLALGFLAATSAVAAAIPLAWWARRGRVYALPALAIAALCLALPGPVIGMGIIGLMNRPEFPWLVALYDASLVPPWLAMFVRSLPLTILVLWHALRTVPEEMLESAAIAGAGPVRRLWAIALPGHWAALGVAWAVAFAVAIGDLAASVLVAPPGLTTLSMQIFDLLHSGVEDRVAGISLALWGLLWGLVAAIVWLGSRYNRRRDGADHV